MASEYEDIIEAPNFTGFHSVYNFRKINSPFYGLDGKSHGYDFSNEPTFLTFTIKFDLDNEEAKLVDPETNLMASPLFCTDDNEFGAYTYLKARNRFMEANLLLKFKEKLKDISNNNPWFFKSIDGVDKLWSVNTDMSKPLKNKDSVLKINTLESLDLSMAYIADLYRLFTFDSKFMREILPDNLRWFTMHIYVCEFRNIRLNAYDGKRRIRTASSQQNLFFDFDSKNHTIDENDFVFDQQYNWFDSAKTFHHYKLSMCEFDFSETVPYSNLSIAKTPEMAENNFSIRPNWSMELNSYDLQTYLKDVKHAGGGIRLNHVTRSDNSTHDFLGILDMTNSLINVMDFGTSIVNGDFKDKVKSRVLAAAEAVAGKYINAGQRLSDSIDNYNNAKNPKENQANVTSQYIYTPDDTGDAVETEPNAAKQGTGLPEETNSSTKKPIITKQTKAIIIDRKQSVGEATKSEITEQTFLDKDANVTISDITKQEFSDATPNVTISDIAEQEFEDIAPNVTLSDVTEQEFDLIAGIPTVSDVTEQEFEDITPNVAISDVAEQEFADIDPNVTISDVTEQEFKQEEGIPTISDVVELEFKKTKATPTLQSLTKNNHGSGKGTPTISDIDNEKETSSKLPNPTIAMDPIELEFSSQNANPVKSDVDAEEEENHMLKQNVTRSR